MVREILLWPDPRLRETAKEVTKFDEGVRALVADLFETMYGTGNGVGLAATQIGVGQRVVVIDVSPKQEDSAPRAYINPVLVSSEGQTIYEEGCLSVPNEAEEVVRAAQVTVQAFDQDGQPFTVEADGLLAIALQHEMDHLNGVLFVDHISPLKREMIKRRMKRLKAERAEDKAKGQDRSTV